MLEQKLFAKCNSTIKSCPIFYIYKRILILNFTAAIKYTGCLHSHSTIANFYVRIRRKINVEIGKFLNILRIILWYLRKNN